MRTLHVAQGAGTLMSGMQNSLLTGVRPSCTARGMHVGGRCKDSGCSGLLPSRKQQGLAQPAGCRQHCVHTRAAKLSSGSGKLTSTRILGGSGPSMAAASHHSQGQADTQPQKGASPQQEITALDESKHVRDSYNSQQALPPKTNSALQYLNNHKVARLGLGGAMFLLAGSLLVASFRVFSKYNTPENKRKRNVNKNKVVVESLAEYLPNKRSALTPNVAWNLQKTTGFTTSEIFRKYLWYLLRERKFDSDAVNDVVQLKASLQLSDAEVSAAIQERAKRIYDKYGNVMLDVKGMTKAGVERKATCQALFSKLLYLAECDSLLPHVAELANKTNVPDVFGATQEDTERLRIVNLEEMDMDMLEGQFDCTDTDAAS